MDMTEQGGIHLMDKVIDHKNLWIAYEKVRKNKGAPGVDGITVYQLQAHMDKYYKELRRKLKEGTYHPQPVKRVGIPKPDGSKRYLGIPCVLDRVVQQAILQVIEPIIDPHFSPNSFGFRKKRNAHQAMELASQFYEEGYRVVVDCDLKSYFDTIHHQRVHAYLEEFISDKILLRLIWKFLRSGILDKDIYIETTEGAPQGGPLSPLLANVYLNKLDRELEKRGHRFIRYADDFVIYVKSKRSDNRNFLRVSFTESNGKVGCRPSKSAKQRLTTKLKKLTSRKRPGTFHEIITEINKTTIGWINYYGISRMKTFIEKTNQWLNHRIRQLIWKRWKRVRTRYKKLRQYGIGHEDAMKTANSRKGYWRISRSETLHQALTVNRLNKWGLKDMVQLYEKKYSKG
ncbi:group II intron reverse transcriptase/maturase [Alkalihalobacillus sp. 1P02AB]|uniref:group II intron reverse transcriptase/maturase n=1 Tax=Alkalihalobacillus sp. 1P02AB TaxID=3132260 RepID=UPI0039A4792C